MEKALLFPPEIDELKSIGSGKGGESDLELVEFPEKNDSPTPDWKLQILKGIEDAEYEVACWKKMCAVLKDRVVFQYVYFISRFLSVSNCFSAVSTLHRLIRHPSLSVRVTEWGESERSNECA